MSTFNPNQLVLEKIRAVEEYDLSTNELLHRYSQIEDPSLKTTADGTTVQDAMGAEICTFYKNQAGTFGFTNSLLSLDLASSQFGSDKVIADDVNKILVPVSEIIDIASDATVTLHYVPVGTTGAEVSFVKIISNDDEFGATYTVSATAGDGLFTIDAASKKITLPEGTTGQAFVQYNRESSTAVSVGKATDGVPMVVSLLIHAIFHDKCNPNTVYAGVIQCPRAQIDPSSVEIGLKSDSKHSATYKLQKEYCNNSAKLFNIIVAQD
jgi:hypothetical protein